jgi:hypothetical protein
MLASSTPRMKRNAYTILGLALELLDHGVHGCCLARPRNTGDVYDSQISRERTTDRYTQG